MLFNSLQFLVFFPTVVCLYFLIPHRFRWGLLLAASYYFYMCWKAEYVVLIMASTLVDYFAAIQMHRCAGKSGRRKYLALSLATNLGLLFAFKYANFASDSLRDVLSYLNIFYDFPTFDLLLPVGISFYTFQTLSYTIDVYRGRRKPQRHLGKFALYVAFFPQLVAGPIERSERLLPQFDLTHRFDYSLAKDGLKLMLWGFFKKVVIADQAAIYVNAVYGQPEQHGGLSLLIASYLFAFQIYCDFSGYSDIAIGSSRVMGFRLTENFNRPFFAKSIGEFWQRWHISLSTWFRDYVFMPLSLSRFMRSHLSIHWMIGVALMITWFLVGAWHGADWHFVIWGVYQAVLLISGRVLARVVVRRARTRSESGSSSSGDDPSAAGEARWRRQLNDAVWVVCTFHLVVIGLVMFRADTVGGAFSILTAIATDFEISREAMLAGLHMTEFCAICLPIVFLNGIELRQGDRTFSEFLGSRSLPSRFAIYCVLILGIACLGVADAKEFIYFQF